MNDETVPVKSKYLPDPKSTTCTNCKSEDTRSFEMVYTSGTSTSNTIAGTYNGEDGFGLIQGKTRNQSLLAQRVLPPTKPRDYTFMLAVVGGFAALLTGIFLSLILFSAIPLLQLFCFVVLPLIGIFTGWRYGGKNAKTDLNRFNHALSIWRRSWICLRCGNTWRHINVKPS